MKNLVVGNTTRRMGDAIVIDGDYQQRAAESHNPVQRFWHHAKLLAIDRYLPPLPGEFVLDVGCGSGVVSSFLGSKGARVLGIDANQAAISFASKTYGTSAVTFLQAQADDPLPVETPVDKIYCLEVIEHMPMEQVEHMLGNFQRALKPGGEVMLTTPNYRSCWPLLEWIMDRLGFAPTMAGCQHVTRFHPAPLATVCRNRSFRIATLASFNAVAPWLASISWRWALRTWFKEIEVIGCWGCLLVTVLKKPNAAIEADGKSP